MSNRRQSGWYRKLREGFNGPRRREPDFIPKRRRGGELARGEGGQNWPYGARSGASPSILTVHAFGGRERRQYGAVAGSYSSDELNAMTRVQLRALAKERGLSGYGKLNKAGLIGVLA